MFRVSINNYLVVPWTITLLLFRPSLVGEIVNPLIFLIFISLTVCIFIFTKDLFYISINKTLRLVAGAIFLTAIYFLLQGMVLSQAKGTVINSFVVIFGTTAALVYVLRNPLFVLVSLKTVILTHFFLSCSAIITLLIYIIVGLNASKLPLLYSFVLHDMDMKSAIDFSGYSIYFPFTAVWSSLNIGIVIPRCIGLYREPGMAQIFFLTSYFLTYFIQIKYLKFIRAVLFVGSILTFSTAGFLSFIGGSVALNAFNKELWKNPVKIVFKGCLLFFMIFSIFLLPSIGVFQKMENQSGNDRIVSYLQGIQRVAKHPIFGEGYYNGFKRDENGALLSEQFLGIPGVIYQIGFLGLLFYCLCWYFGSLKLASLKTICIYMPCFLTLLISQPSYNDVFTWFLLLVNTRNLRFQL
jgi:hypothetical protein